jgi:colanic acid biosynthesis glycosyl transferase WcaI
MEEQLHIALISTHFAPEVTPITHLYADLAEDLCRFGARVSVVTKLPGHEMSEQERAAFYSRRDEIAPEGYRIQRVGKKARRGANLVERAFRAVQNTIAIYRAAKKLKADVYILCSKPAYLGLVGARLSRRARTVYILQEIFPDNLVAAGRYTEWHPVVRFCRRMEQHIYRRNSAFITLSEEMKRTLVARGVEPEKIAVIPNWADTEAILPILREDNALFDEFNLPRDGFYAVYAGTLGFLQEPDVILDAAKLLKNEKDIRILVFGDGALREHLENRIEREQIENVLLFPLLSSTQTASVYSLADVVLVPLKKGMTRIAVPSETQLALAAGRPLIVCAEAGSEWARSIEHESFGLCIMPGEPQEMADAILRLHASTVPLSELGARARSYACEHASRAQATKAYFDWIKG